MIGDSMQCRKLKYECRKLKLIDRKVVKAQEIKWWTEGKVTSFLTRF